MTAHRERLKQIYARRAQAGLSRVGRPSRGKAKAVACVDEVGRRLWVFGSVTAAARAVGTGKVDNICDAISRGGKCAGLRWAYADALPLAYRDYAVNTDLALLAAAVRALAVMNLARDPAAPATRSSGGWVAAELDESQWAELAADAWAAFDPGAPDDPNNGTPCNCPACGKNLLEIT